MKMSSTQVAQWALNEFILKEIVLWSNWITAGVNCCNDIHENVDLIFNWNSIGIRWPIESIHERGEDENQQECQLKCSKFPTKVCYYHSDSSGIWPFFTDSNVNLETETRHVDAKQTITTDKEPAFTCSNLQTINSSVQRPMKTDQTTQKFPRQQILDQQRSLLVKKFLLSIAQIIRYLFIFFKPKCQNPRTLFFLK